ncbi:MAG: hypothetical protein LBV69_04765 [Bacteroidales bacterium]|jgi:hypothetical protein|nr:hypothetical protein [Bacteroidales bacterium]
MKQNLTFNRSIIASTESKIDVNSFDLSMEAFEKKEYLNSFELLLKYINPAIKELYGNPEGTEFYIPHGSIIVSIKIEDNQLKISAPFLALPEKGRIPMMRQIAVLNFSSLNMIQIKLKNNDKLFFEYACPIELVQPWKIYDVLDDICYMGDKYDDEFITKFGATRIYEPKITPYDDVLLNNIYDIIQLSCKECMDAVTYFEGIRKYGSVWNIISITLYKILYYAYPQGQLLNDLNRAVHEMDRDDIPLTDINADAKKIVQRLQKMTKKELSEDLYFTETFVPSKRRSILKNIQDNFEDEYDRATNAIEAKDYITCGIVVVYNFYSLYFYNNLQDDVNDLVVQAMEKASAKPWEEAAPILYKAMKKIMDGDLTLEKEEESKTNTEFDMSAYMNVLKENMQNINMQEFAKNMQEIAAIFSQNKKEEK